MSIKKIVPVIKVGQKLFSLVEEYCEDKIEELGEKAALITTELIASLCPGCSGTGITGFNSWGINGKVPDSNLYFCGCISGKKAMIAYILGKILFLLD